MSRADHDVGAIQSLRASEYVRRRPELYLRDCLSTKSLSLLPFAAACEALEKAGEGQCQTLDIELFEEGFGVNFDLGLSLHSHGSGLPVAEVLLTKLYACRDQKRTEFVAEDYCVVPIMAINALSVRCELVTICQGEKATFHFEKGETVSKMAPESCSESDRSRLRFWLDFEILRNLKVDLEGVRAHAADLKVKLPQLTVTVSDRRKGHEKAD